MAHSITPAIAAHLRAGSTMPSYPELLAAAHKSELARSRRLSKAGGLSLHAALAQILEKSATTATPTVAPAAALAQLLAERERARRAQERAQQAAQAVRKHDQQARLQAHRAAREAAPDPGGAWRASFDGSARPNPGRLGIGGLVHGPHGQLITISRAAGHGDSSDAEYAALDAVLAAALAAGATRLQVWGDSRVVIDDVARARAALPGLPGHGAPTCVARLATARARVLAQLAQFEQVSLSWIPRKKNAAADALSQQAIGYDDAPAAEPPTCSSSG